MPVALMIRAAYDIPNFQLSGVSGWANTEHAAECLPPQPGAVAAPTPDEPPRCGGRFDVGRISLRGTTMQQFANLLGRSVFASTLLDKTDLAGKYDLDLDYAPDPAPPTPAAPDPAPADPNNPSIYTAIQEQLRLTLDSIKAPGQVLVITTLNAQLPIKVTP